MANEDEVEQQPDLTKAEKLAEYKQLRSSAKGNITRVKTAVSKRSIPDEELECRSDILEAYFKQALSINTNILRICPPTECEGHERAMADIEDIYVAAKAKIKERLKAGRGDANESMLNATTAATSRSSMRRHIKLPTFDGKYSEFPKFMAIFNKMVNQDETLDDCERFLILKDNLSARALQAVDDFEITSSNYRKALDRLKNNFDKKNLMFEEHIAALFSGKRVSSADGLREMVDSVNTHLSAMLSLGNYKDITNAMLIYLVAAKLDEESLAKWEESIDYTRLSTWDECSAVLTKRCENMEARETRSGRCIEQDEADSKTKRKENHKTSGVKKTTLAIAKGGCEICKKDGHNVGNCRKFDAMRIHQRRKTARRLRLCFLCLQAGHRSSSCHAKPCMECGGDHHQMLHKSNQEAKSTDLRGTTQAEMASQGAVHTTIQDEGAEVILATAEIIIKAKNGLEFQARALLDSASQLNLMCEPLMKKLNLKWTSCIMTAHSISESGTTITRKAQASIKSRIGGYETSLEFYVLPKITSFKPDQFMHSEAWGIPSNIQLADPNFNKPGRIDVLLGAEVFWDLLSVGRITLKENLPRLQKTVLGWVVSGVSTRNDANEGLKSSVMMTSSKNTGEEEELTALVEKFWLMEQVDEKAVFPTAEEELCEKIFINESRRDDSGRFVVKIPFRENVTQLGDSYQAALRRFVSLERRLKKNPAIKEMYDAFIDEYLALGHMALVPKSSRERVKYFSPHTFVLRPESTSTKLRVVFDCSCQTTSGLSLNDVMMKGPTIQDDLLAIVLRFRCYKYAITADVTKMYRQAWVSDEDSYYQCIVWRPSEQEDIEVYRLMTITYGTASAPYLATKCIQALGEQYAETLPYGARKVLSDFYMDDLISGAESEEQLHQIYSQVSMILNAGGFELRKWYSNNTDFLESVPANDRGKPLRLNDTEIIKTLGIVWEPNCDQFCYNWPEIELNKPVTKRIVLAEVASLFDPLGLLNPIIVKAKVLLQNLWILKVHWDESLPMEDNAQWIRFREKLSLVKDIKLPRYVLSNSKPERVELHGFCDASMRAYGACIYIRTVDAQNETTVTLWGAKSRVAPLKTKSLPRLELLGAELLAKLLNKTQENLVASADAIYLWTDSEIVLNWLSRHPSEWSIFVANRVATIQERTKKAIWRHVPTKSNPADVISRGAYADELMETCWFTGPSFLKETCDKWPPNKWRDASEANDERRKAVALPIENRANRVQQWLESHSNFGQIQRKVAYLLHFFRNKTKQKVVATRINEPILTAALLNEAWVRIMYCVQQQHFGAEIKALQRGKELPPGNKLRNLSVFLTLTFGVLIMRVGGRLARAQLPYDAKFPIILPSESPIVRIYIQHLHESNMHVGPQALMSMLRQHCWVVNARRLVRQVTTKCFRCFHSRPKLCEQVMGHLPSRRVAVTRPFYTTGVDFCGPFLTTVRLRGARTVKSYLAVMVCFTTKAVHIEVVSDLSTKAFMAALKRFVARRGLCHHIYCDNGTNFVGARREMQEWKQMFFSQQQQHKISELCAVKGIEWHHIPPRSPHFGGLWEAAVKSAKYHLTRILGDAHFTFEELCTITAEIEAILNSRPLCICSADPNDEEVLTPAHFLVGSKPEVFVEPVVEPNQVRLRDQWQRLTLIKQHFWARWSREYLPELQRKGKWTTSQRNLAVGDLVLVAEDNAPPGHWLIGRVEKVVTDEAGAVRVVEVRTKNGCIKRAIHKLARIPTEDEDTG